MRSGTEADSDDSFKKIPQTAFLRLPSLRQPPMIYDPSRSRPGWAMNLLGTRRVSVVFGVLVRISQYKADTRHQGVIKWPDNMHTA
jgi:hypothetical protein